MKQIVGIDIGGSHISAGILQNGMTIDDADVAREPVNSLGTKEEILGAWGQCIQSLGISKHTLLGIAMPAPFDYENGVSLILEQGKYLSLYQVNVKLTLADRLGLPVDNIAFINDAAAFLQGEAHAAGWPGNTNLMGITLGTGLGGAFKSGKFAEDGAIWSIPFKGGIAEDYLSTSFFTKWAKVHFGIEVHGLKDLLTNQQTREDTLAKLRVFAGHLADLILLQQESRKIDKVILGGNMVKAAAYFLPEVKRILQDFGSGPELLISRLGEKAAMIGAASIHNEN
ncbi:ROK family protein [Cyclobacterium sp.]|uniref:ROK family protein n=1 Tax=Cyclobacterium sp. TaxID=1966343 RepID=UPI0019BD61E4|nr:ROK family protein [Cyclobacterium sp.]MBD3628071.1 ROK family protein [Cyclobacterium sp.]